MNLLSLWTPMWSCGTMGWSPGTHQPSPKAPVWWMSSTSPLITSSATWPLVPGPTMAIRWTYSMPWTVETSLTSLKMWSGRSMACQQWRTWSPMAAALSLTPMWHSLSFWRGGPPSISSTSSSPASSYLFWRPWVFISLQPLGKRSPWEWPSCWPWLCFSSWWQRSCRPQKTSLW